MGALDNEHTDILSHFWICLHAAHVNYLVISHYSEPWRFVQMEHYPFPANVENMVSSE